MGILTWTEKRIKNLDLVKIAALVLAVSKPKFKKTKKIKD